MKIETGISQPEVVLHAGLEYRKIPGFVSAYAGANGKVLFVKSDGSIMYPSEFEWKTTLGTYKYIKIVSDDFIQVTKAVHQLVCRTYKGSPPSDGFIYEPNHIDGNKHNNRPDNLEWMTRSKNVQHAYDNGLCTQGLRIEVTDIANGIVTTYNSLSALSRLMGIPRYQLREIIAKHRSVPYLGLYTFVLDDRSDKKVTRHQERSVIYKDYISGIITIARTSQDASVQTGVKVGSIALRTRNNDNKTLLSKYVFLPLEENIEWPIYTVEDALEAEIKYFSKYSSTTSKE